MQTHGITRTFKTAQVRDPVHLAKAGPARAQTSNACPCNKVLARECSCGAVSVGCMRAHAHAVSYTHLRAHETSAHL
eukprot:10380913-Alexandrium_andersonii.AAC.1